MISRFFFDDVIPVVPPPLSDSFDDWQATYVRYACFLKDLTHYAFTLLGLKLNLDKGALLVPAGAPMPSDVTRDRYPQGFVFETEGFRVAGSPIGNDRFMTEFVCSKVNEARTKVACIKLVGAKSPRAAHRLLICCASKLMSFLSSTVPPHIMMPALREFDDLIEAAFFEVLSSTQVQCSEERMHRARLKLHLPSPIGCGLTRSLEQGAFAWWVSASACLNDPLLFSLRSGLSKFCTYAWSTMLAMLGGGQSKLWTQIKHLLPGNANGLVDGSKYSPLNEHKNSLNKVALKALSSNRIEKFRALASPALITEDGRLTVSDVIQTGSHSYAGRIFASSLKDAVPFAFSPAAYVAWAFFFLVSHPSPQFITTRPNMVSTIQCSAARASTVCTFHRS